MNPMEMLIEAANAMNPKQFELPRSMSVPCVFPGTDKGKVYHCTYSQKIFFFQLKYLIRKLEENLTKLETMKKVQEV